MHKSTLIGLLYLLPVLTIKSSVKRRHHYKRTSLMKQEDHSLYKLVPQGCYGRKHLLDMSVSPQLKKHHTHNPKTPGWCSESEFLVPKQMRAQKAKTTAPPYHIQVHEFQNSKNVFKGAICPFKSMGMGILHPLKFETFHMAPFELIPSIWNSLDFSTVIFTVNLKSEHSSPIYEAILVARPVGSGGKMNSENVGRFLKSPGVNLICCSKTDKNVAKFKSTTVFVDEIVFYWAPYEEVTEDFEGGFIFIATVAKNSDEYWINITSKPMSVLSTASKMFDSKNINSRAYINE